MKDTLIQMIIVQSIAQTMIYFSIAWLLAWLLQRFVNFFGMITRSKINKITMLSLFMLNIIITIFARYLTNNGALSGTANLAASCILTIIMWLTFRTGGMFYIKSWEPKRRKLNANRNK